MRRLPPRLRVNQDGGVEVVDPGLEDVPFLQSIDSTFAVRTAPLPGFTRPRLHATRAQWTGISAAGVKALPLAELWAAHEEANVHGEAAAPGLLNLLQLKAGIARRLLSKCVLCARRCGVNRLAGEAGACGLLADAYAAESFVHVAEEPFINPSLCLNLRGCALRCRACQQYAILDPRGSSAERLTAASWAALDLAEARSLSFVGGNPDESLAAILAFLCAAPADFPLPIVWNSNAYGSEEGLRLLRGVADCYVPDLKFHREACAASYTRVRDYADAARATVARLLDQDVPVIVRVLLVPGHVACCHIPSLEWLASLRAPHLYVSLRRQYAPDWRITPRDNALAGRLPPAEAHAAFAAAQALDLQLVE